MIRHTVTVALIAISLAAAAASAQDPDLSGLPHYRPEQQVSGAIRVFGSDLKGNVVALENGFLKYHPATVFSNSFHTSSEGAMAGLYTGLADIAPAGDDAKITDQMPFYNTFRYLPLEVSVATGGYEARGTLWAFAVVVSKDNPIDGLSVEQLKRIFGAERTGGWSIVDDDYLYSSAYARAPESNIRTWGQLGLTGDWADKEIQTYGYCSPGFAIYFERNWFHWSHKWNPNFQEFVEEKQTSPDAAGKAVASERALEEISRNRYAIGLAALMHVKDYPGVKVLALSHEDGEPFVPLTPETVSDRTYPLIRDAFIYLNHPPGQPLPPKVKEFMRFALSREGQEIIAGMQKYYPLTPDYLQEQLAKLD